VKYKPDSVITPYGVIIYHWSGPDFTITALSAYPLQRFALTGGQPDSRDC